MQASLNSHFKVSKRHTLMASNGKMSAKSLHEEDTSIIVSSHKEKADDGNIRNVVKATKRLSGLNDSYEAPEISSNRKKVKLERVKSKGRTIKKVNQINRRITFAPVEDSTKMLNLIKNVDKRESNSKSSTSTTDTVTQISSKTQNIIDAVLKRKVPNIEENFHTPLKFNNINNNFSVTNSVAAESSNKTDKDSLKLSQKTMEVIQQLKTERKNRFNREPTVERLRSESSFSMRFKYEDLLKEERELILPPSYKSLYNSFSELDNTLNIFKLGNRKHRIPVLEDIKSSIESTYKHKFEMNTFLKLLYVVPHFFVYKWERNVVSSDYSLILDHPKDSAKRIKNNYEQGYDFTPLQTNYDPMEEPLTNSLVEERKRVFKNILLEIVRVHHDSFLKDIKFERDFDPFKLKTWHHEFDLAKVPEVPILEIQDNPTKKVVTINDFLKDNDIKNTLIKKAIENVHVNNLWNVADAYTTPTKKSDRLSQILSGDLLSKIKAKEGAIQMSKSILDYSTQKNQKKNHLRLLKDVADKIRTAFMFKRANSIGLNDLCTRVLISSDNIRSHLSPDKLKTYLYKLIEVFPDWLKLRDHSEHGTLVIIDNAIHITDILGRVEKPEILSQFENMI